MRATLQYVFELVFPQVELPPTSVLPVASALVPPVIEVSDDVGEQNQLQRGCPL